MKSPLILLADDDAPVRKALTSILESAGYRVLPVSNGFEAQKGAGIQQPDLVISDVCMPGMDGYELVRSLRAEPPFLPTPIILISGVFHDEAAIGLARSFGVRHFLAKPVAKETLLAAVEDALRAERALPSFPSEQLEREHNRVLIDKLNEKIDALAASEERFRQMAENIGDVFWLSDRGRTKILYVSPAYEGIWGRSCESLYASPRSWADTIHPEDRLRIAQVESPPFVTGGREQTYRIVRPDGSVRWILDREFPVQDEFGQVIRMAGLAKDITERKQAEEVLCDSEARLRLSVTASNIGHWDWNLVTNDVYFSPQWKVQLGYGPDEIPNRFEEWQSRLHPDDLPGTLAKVKRALEDPAGKYAHEFRLRHKNGSYRWIFTKANTLRNEAGKPVRMMGCHVDITELKEAERNIAAQARRQAAVAALGQRALANVSVNLLCDEAVVLAARCLEAQLSEVFSLLPDGRALKLVAEDGWAENSSSRATVEAGPHTEAGYALHVESPVVVEDLRTEARFRAPPLLHQRGVVSGVSVIIGNAANPWGVLGVHTCHQRPFSKDDIHFVQSLANVLGAAIARERAEHSLIDLSCRLMHAEDAERRRIAKELHDSTAQDLVAAMINLESLRDGVAERNPAEARHLEDSIALVENAAHEIRTLSYLFHPPRLDEEGLIGAIRHYAAGFGERTGIATSVDLPANLERLGAPVEVVLFRVVQECLGNIHRHAQSPTAFVRLEHGVSGLLVEVRDEGRGIPPQVMGPMPGQFTGLGVGLPGMRERMRYIGGTLEIDSSPRGTTVRALVPGPIGTGGLGA